MASEVKALANGMRVRSRLELLEILIGFRMAEPTEMRMVVEAYNKLLGIEIIDGAFWIVGWWRDHGWRDGDAAGLGLAWDWILKNILGRALVGVWLGPVRPISGPNIRIDLCLYAHAMHVQGIAHVRQYLFYLPQSSHVPRKTPTKENKSKDGNKDMTPIDQYPCPLHN